MRSENERKSLKSLKSANLKVVKKELREQAEFVSKITEASKDDFTQKITTQSNDDWIKKIKVHESNIKNI